MSQNHNSTSAFISKSFMMLTAFMILWLVFALSASAAVVPNSKKRAGTFTASVDLASLGGFDEQVLDWRRPFTTVRFDVPDGNYAQSLTLKLSATPQNGVSSSTPLMVSLNNSKPVPVHSKGRRFDAEIKLATLRLRSRGNELKITYKTPSGQDCLLPNHGSWTINMARSKITMTSRDRSRSYRLDEIEPRLSSALTAPKKVSIVARGSEKTAYEALSAQAIGLRVSDIPRISLAPSKAPFSIYVGTRSDLARYNLDAPKVMNATGPVLGLTEDRPLKLILTGDTTDEVMAVTKAFAHNHVPAVRRTFVSLGEMQMQIPLTPLHLKPGSSTKLYDIGNTEFDFVYRPNPVILKFATSDTHQGEGEVLLDINRNGSVADNSTLSVDLNGRTLGTTQLNKSRKKVSFTIPAGTLRAGENEMVITPLLEAKSAGCTGWLDAPGVGLGEKSRLKLGAPSNQQALSSFASSGGVFAANYGSKTQVLLPKSSEADRSSALRVLAMSSKTSGYALSEARFTLAGRDMTARKNIIAILPRRDLPKSLTLGAPKAFKDGLVRSTIPLSSEMSPVLVAGVNDGAAFALAAKASQQRVQMGGLAAIYTTPAGQNVVTFTAAPSVRFAAMADKLVRPAHWQQLSGSVTRWNSRRVLSVQAGGIKMPVMSAANSTRSFEFDGFEFNMPSLEMPEFNMPEFKRPSWMSKPSPAAPARPAPVLRDVKPVSIAQALPKQTLPKAAPKAAAPSLKLRGRSAPDMTIAPRPAATAKAGEFSWDYFTANVRSKARSLRNSTQRTISGNTNTQSTAQWFTQALKTKTLWLFLAAALLVLGMATAVPSSSNRHH